jgi:colicin import membrane protein
MLVQQITRRYIDTVFDVARVPVGVAQLAAGRRADPAWPPRLVFASFESGAKQALGALLSDDVLVAEGQIEASRVADLREAVRLEEQAQRLREEADAGFERRQRNEQDRRAQVEADAERRREAADRDRARAEQKASEEAARARQAAQENAERRQAAIAKQERADRLATIEEEKAALQRDEQATRAAAEVVQVDRKIQASKKARTVKKKSSASTKATTGEKSPARSARRLAVADRPGSSRAPRT